MKSIFADGGKPYFWIALIGFIVYAQSLFFGFVHFDDNILILENNRFISQLSNLPQAFYKDVFLFRNVPDLYYRPVLTASLIIDAQLGQTAPFVYHLTNLLLHLAVSLLVFLFFIKLGKNRETAFIFSLLFAVHPILAKAVAWIPGRNDLLLALFVLPAFLSFLEYLEDRKPLYLPAHLLFLTAALFTKESALMVIPLCIYYYLQVKKRPPLSIASLVVAGGWTAILLAWFLLRNAAFKHPAVFSLWESVRFMGGGLPALPLYVGKVFFPFNLSVLPILRDSNLWYGAVATVIVLTLLLFSKKKKLDMVILGVAWFLLFLLPCFISPVDNSINPVADLSDHRMYLPLLGIFLVIMEIDFVKMTENKYFRIASVLVLLLFSAVNLDYARNLGDRDRFWSNAVSNSPHFPKAHINLGLLYQSRGELKRAENSYKRAVELNENEPYAHDCLGLVYAEMKLWDRAEKEYLKELKRGPNEPIVYSNLAAVYLNQERWQEAEINYQKALRLDPLCAPAHIGWGVIFERSGFLGEAGIEYRKALEINPSDADAHNNLGNIYAKTGLYKKAEKEYLVALKLRPDYRTARKNLKVLRSLMK